MAVTTLMVRAVLSAALIKCRAADVSTLFVRVRTFPANRGVVAGYAWHAGDVGQDNQQRGSQQQLHSRDGDVY